MASTPRIAFQNWSQLTNATLTVSSEEAAYPKAWLKDPLRSKVWRSKIGWTVVTGYNDKINITEGSSSPSTALATVAAGTYATGSLMSAAIVTALNAVAENTWSCSYSGTTFKYTIEHDGVSTAAGATGTLDWSSGGSQNTSIATCLGFNLTSDLQGTTSFTGQTAVYQSRQWAKFDLGSDRSIQLALFHHNNVSSDNNGTVKIQAHTSDAWTAPTISTSMSGGEIWNTWMTSAITYRWWRFEINNTEDVAGFTYAGVPFLGTYLEPSPGLSIRHTESYIQLSEIGFADNGAPFQHEKDQMRGYTLTWVGLTDSEKDKLKQAVEYLRVGRPFFFSVDPTNDADGIVYSIMTKGGSIQKVAPSYWQVVMKTEEAIG